jgi:hypothetical protein
MSELSSRDATTPLDHEMPIAGHAHEDIKDLYQYWSGLAPSGVLPGRRHFDPLEIPHLLPNVWLIDVHRDPFRFWRRLVGTRIEEFAGRSLVNGWVADTLDEDRQSGVHKNLTDVVLTGQPSWRRGKSLIRYEKGFSELERIYLPLAEDGGTVDMILAMTLFYTLPMPDADSMNEHFLATETPAFVYG